MQKRSVIFGKYDTAAYGWTLTGCVLSDPEQKTNYVEKANGDGSWDLSTVMTDGQPRYKDRSLTVTLECSEGNRADRQELISHLVNLLDGLVYDITLPDYPSHYITGRLHVAVNYSDLAHCAVTIAGTCGPWLYRKMETVITVNAANTENTVNCRNNGRLAMVPQITTTGNVLLEFGTASLAVAPSTFEWSDMLLSPGDNILGYSGSGTMTITYREAVLR